MVSWTRTEKDGWKYLSPNVNKADDSLLSSKYIMCYFLFTLSLFMLEPSGCCGEVIYGAAEEDGNCAVR